MSYNVHGMTQQERQIREQNPGITDEEVQIRLRHPGMIPLYGENSKITGWMTQEQHQAIMEDRDEEYCCPKFVANLYRAAKVRASSTSSHCAKS